MDRSVRHNEAHLDMDFCSSFDNKSASNIQNQKCLNLVKGTWIFFLSTNLAFDFLLIFHCTKIQNVHNNSLNQRHEDKSERHQ